MKTDLLIKILSYTLAQQDFGDDRGNPLSRQEIERLLFQYNSYLLALLNYKLNDRDLAEDILQETYLSFLSGIRKKGNTFNSEKKLKNYLITIAVNKVKDFYKSHGYHSEKLHLFYTTEELDHFLSNISSGSITPDEELEKKEKEEHISRTVALVMEKLPVRYYEILILKFTENKENKEIALQLEMTKKGVESLLFRAKKAFKKEFNKYSVNANENLF